MARRMQSAALVVCVAALLSGACGTARSDETIAGEIDQQLANSPVLGGAEIDVTARGGIVTLSGVVSSEEQRAHAESLARGVEGVESVESRLEVASAPSAAPPAVVAPPPERPEPGM